MRRWGEVKSRAGRLKGGLDESETEKRESWMKVRNEREGT